MRLILLGVLAAIGGTCAYGATGAATDSTTAARARIEPCAVVELFTSEGCSSCPPADAVLAEIEADARKTGKRVFPLAFHVDYWNQLGWRDRFSDAAYSRRQSDYARARGTDQIYTPEMLVNGGADFVGSDGDKAKRVIAAALAVPAAVGVSLQLKKMDSGGVVVQYALTGETKGAVVNVAVVERNLSTQVGAGENGGRLLRHENVVRWFREVPVIAGRKAEETIPALPGVDGKQASVIVYVQEQGGGRVLGAADADFP